MSVLDVSLTEFGDAIVDTAQLMSGDINTVSACLDAGIDPNVLLGGDGVDDRRALAVQCMIGRVEIVRLLLERGANPNLGRESTNETPLHHAVTGSRNLEIVDMLLREGAEPNSRCATGVLSINFMRDVRVRGETPLHRAAAYADSQVIRRLLDAGADSGLKDANGDSALSWAALHRRDRDILKLLCYGDIHI